MSEPRCPHCQTVLPETGSFCAACGNRIEGWSAVPAGKPPTLLAGGDEPTTNMKPTPSLLRAAALSKRPAPSAELPVPRNNPLPIVGLLALGVLAAGAGYYFASRPSAPAVAPVAAPRPAAANAPVSATAPLVTPAPVRLSVPIRPQISVTPKVPRIHALHRIEPLALPAPKPLAKKLMAAGGALPHKSVATDSRPMSKPVSEAAKLAVTGTDAPADAPPQTDDELKKQAEAALDADSIRFVVKSHLSQVHACYERAFKESSPGGRVEIGFAITADGAAARVRTESNTTGSEPLAACLESRVRSWQFPRPVGGDYELIYPFVFAPGS